MKRKILVTSYENNNWKGEIEILNMERETVYVKWFIEDENNRLVASFTNNYFIGGQEYTNEQIFYLVIDRILKYRIKRRKIFKDVILGLGV